MLIEIAKRRAFPVTERVIGEWHRDRDIDADHANLNLGGEIARRIAVSGENRKAESTGPKTSSL